jgi:GT2 family glycosyltransferase/glycosyltransferase involved in cell wall biosynthesis
MLAFWDELLWPLVEVIRPERILEIGSDKGGTTRALLDYARSTGAVLHAIDPKPDFDVDELREAYGGAFVFHAALSLEVLPTMENVDFALIDGDHNWYTVLNELRILERRALEAGESPPVIALHDMEWPYARRDLYYDPDNIPADVRRPFEYRGIHPDSEQLVDDGINGHLANARLPAAKHSGVRGAVEDFVEESSGWKLFDIGGEHGLGVLVAKEVLKTRASMRSLLAATAKPPFLIDRVKSVERARIDVELRRVKAIREQDEANRNSDKVRAELAKEREGRAADAKDARRLARRAEEAAQETKQANTAALNALRDELDDAKHRMARLEAQRDAGDKREVALEDELATERRAARTAREGTEVAEERRLRDAERSREVQTGLEARSAELEKRLEHKADLLAASEAAAAVLERRLGETEVARARMVADFEDGRESLERTIDESRAQADTGRHAAAELRELLEERELDVERLNSKILGLQAALGRARVDAEVAQAEGSALERRLRELAALQESTVAEIGKESHVQDPAERIALQSFATAYEPLSSSGVDPLALPSPRDRRHLLRGPGADVSSQGPTVDVVVCVHNALEEVRRCLWSLADRASHPFRLIVVNDGSDAKTTAYLGEAAAVNPEITLIHNDSPPHGYTIAANLGMREADGDYVVVLNSDTIVTFGWLERIIACGESDERIGILGPLSNAASHQSLPALRDGGAWATNPLPQFMTENGMAKLLERLSPRHRPRLPFINGFCYVVKRPVFEQIGYFDEENFASGYCEENDFSYRASQAGFELAVVDDAYVFHAKSKSFTPAARKPIAQRNYQIFLEKHGTETIEALVRDIEADSSLAPLRESVGEAISSPETLAAALDVADQDPLNVAFILPGFSAGGSGGAHSVYQEALGLRSLGVPARILIPDRVSRRVCAAYENAAEVFETFADSDELAARTADADVISATHYKSVAMLADLRSRREDFLPAYYVQDYEPFFTAPGSDDFGEAIDSYEAVPDCLLFAKSHWLCNIVGDRHGRHVAKVEPSIDETLFQPDAGRQRDAPALRIVAMVRPRTPRRQPSATLAVLDALQQRFGDRVELVTFGCGGEEMAALTDSLALRERHQGLLSRQQVASLLKRSDVFLDMSMYQAFGRTALEAMACGATAVVPRLGGVWDFVVDGVNALAVDTSSVHHAVEALSSLVGDRDQLRSLQAAALETAAPYSIGRAALSEYLVFSHEHARRFRRERTIKR